ncbi:MAG TPA: glycerol-3-phosphate dehydrogenase, partial [Xanthobacteraceae bacterium]
MADYDLAIIGGGINGAGIARDAAGRGLKVLLVEQNDLASGTSSASTKLVHGGLRYLAFGAFHLVREALAEREVLMRIAPYLVHPMRFVLPAEAGDRPAWMLRIGLMLYDWIGGRRTLPGRRTVDFGVDPVGAPLKRNFTYGFEYSDCAVDDARLVVVNAVDAALRGATIRTRTRCVSAERGAEWTLMFDARGRREVATARVLVNAAGPWLASAAETVLRLERPLPVRLVKGSHIVVKRMFEHDRAYILPSPDGRVVFARPFGPDFTLIGTTDEDFVGDPSAATVEPREVEYLCDVVNGFFRAAIAPPDAVWAFAGVRALYDDGKSSASETTREYLLTLDRGGDRAPLLTVYGGKITTYRHLAETAMTKLAQVFADVRAQTPWTAGEPLPGGDFAPGSDDDVVTQVRRTRPFLGQAHARRLVAAYGTRVKLVLEGVAREADMGPRFGADLTGIELRYLMRYEWAQTADDVLWRRSKLGLHLSKDDAAAVERFMTG